MGILWQRAFGKNSGLDFQKPNKRINKVLEEKEVGMREDSGCGLWSHVGQLFFGQQYDRRVYRR
jgi:hypothetical protein